jgi:hypothetical protein
MVYDCFYEITMSQYKTFFLLRILYKGLIFFKKTNQKASYCVNSPFFWMKIKEFLKSIQIILV